MADPRKVRPAQRELTITRVLAAPRELVFRAWTDPGAPAEAGTEPEESVVPSSSPISAAAPR